MRFEVFNFETKQLINKTKLFERVVYWTWLNSDIIAMVTESAVFHWELFQDRSPEKIFLRHHRLTFSEIISYKADPSLKWMAVTGLTPECISSHAICFSDYHYDDNPSSSTVMCAASRDSNDTGKIHVIELGPYKQGNFAPRNNYDVIQFIDDVNRYDFPVSLHVSTNYKLLFMVTKYGHMYLCDMETAACLCCTRISLS
ncbi:hypothetical protein KUTeg_009940, partial [Tegillarca granosa]